MAGESAVVRNLNATQHQFSPATKPMRVKTVPDANFRGHARCFAIAASSPEGNQQSTSGQR
jgi:hypothetical protein